MYVSLSSVVLDVGVKETITPRDVQFAAKFCLQLSALLFEACSFSYLFTFFIFTLIFQDSPFQ